MQSPLLLAVLLLVVSIQVRAVKPAANPTETDRQMIAAVTAADAERMAATLAGDRDRLNAVLSDELRYAHSNGLVEHKAAFIATVSSRKIVYESFNYQQRDFLRAGPGVILMTGRVLIHAINENKKIVVDLNFLSVWREEAGHWRFLSWQSALNPPAPTAAK